MVIPGNLKLKIVPFDRGVFEVILYDLKTEEVISTLIIEILLQDCEKSWRLDTDGKTISIVPKEDVEKDEWVV